MMPELSSPDADRDRNPGGMCDRFSNFDPSNDRVICPSIRDLLDNPFRLPDFRLNKRLIGWAACLPLQVIWLVFWFCCDVRSMTSNVMVPLKRCELVSVQKWPFFP
jgi:hypothetical protein